MEENSRETMIIGNIVIRKIDFFYINLSPANKTVEL